MLASPLLPAPTIFSSTHNNDDSLSYGPAKDLETFNNLLPPPIEFVEGSSSGTLAVAEGKYEPINTTPKASRSERPETPTASTSTATSPHKQSPSAPPTSTPSKATTSLYTGGIDTSWPAQFSRGSGLYNNGNTCFLNSALQCLLHTPPLLRVLLSHTKDNCRVDKPFCMICSLRQVTVTAHTNRAAFSPTPVSSKLQIIAKHMRKGRQEDSHEFLRYAIDALQKACLAGYPPKIDPKLAETTWVHKIFGGRLRSRVSCQGFNHNSDTYDRILDLSLDIQRSDTLKEALRSFVAMDYLRGTDQYKCEKCKKHVNAQKRFTIHEAPPVLTIHLKRFSPLGKKIGHHVNYDEHLSLKPYMSEGQRGPSYSLYGVICHAGGGPNSGHYYAYIKSKDGRWWEMNDEQVSSCPNPPINIRSAYMLFYTQNKGQGLEAAIESSGGSSLSRGSLVNGMKKRKEPHSGDEDTGEKVSKPFIGPVLPTPQVNGDKPKSSTNPSSPSSPADPQAAKLKNKIQNARMALHSLNGYASDEEEDEGKGEGDSSSKPGPSNINGSKHEDNHAGPSRLHEADPVIQPQRTSTPPPPHISKPPPATTNLAPIPASSFYGGGGNGKKRKSPPDESETQSRKELRGSALMDSVNPYRFIGTKYRSKHRTQRKQMLM
ncbi:cysteine proteinase [Pluteus cervinus]|uniref:Cysteine proteinase n=1 Tax=Pluteus cervinus TaxID=181527 RepID=A0ACD3AR59_9AGAR|nr:cysteine proteinase [Pluteus cervinus]